ncbi:MAG: hypothetical protein JWQ35_1511, partial [Bacteriovoracaceae bacterium]|nr:hypothetical protein [Bacteriovoracaceae bacterium]
MIFRGSVVMKQLNKLSLIFLGALVMASCVSKSGSVQEANQTSSAALMISKVELSSDGTQLVVHANKEPKYNVFKLMDPERIVVDIIDAKLQDGATSVVAENDVVKELKVQALEDSLSSLVRMEIVLKNSANYMAELTSDGMSLRILKGGEMPPEVAKNDVTPPAVQPEKQVEKAPEGSPTEGNALPLPPLPALPVPEANALPLPAIPAPVPSPEVAAPSLSAPIPEAAAPVVKPEEIAKNENLNQNAEVKPPEMKATEQVPEAKIPEVKEEAKAEPVPE